MPSTTAHVHVAASSPSPLATGATAAATATGTPSPTPAPTPTPTLPPTPPSSLLRPTRSQSLSPTRGHPASPPPPAPPALRLDTLPPRILERIARAVGDYTQHLPPPLPHSHDTAAAQSATVLVQGPGFAQPYHVVGHGTSQTLVPASPVPHALPSNANASSHHYHHPAAATASATASAVGSHGHARTSPPPSSSQSRASSSAGSISNVGDPPPAATTSAAHPQRHPAQPHLYFDDHDLDDFHQPSLLALAWTCRSLMAACLPLLWSSLRTDMEPPVAIDKNNTVRLRCTRGGRLFYSDPLSLGPSPTPPPLPVPSVAATNNTPTKGNDSGTATATPAAPFEGSDTGMLSPPASPKLPPAALPLTPDTATSTPPPVTAPPPTRWLFTSDRILACSSGQLYLVDPSLRGSLRRPAIRTIPMHHVRRFRLSLGVPNYVTTSYYTAHYAGQGTLPSWVLPVTLDDVHSLITGSLSRLPALRHLHISTPTPLDPVRLAAALAHMPARAQLVSLYVHAPLTSAEARLDLSGMEFPHLSSLTLHLQPNQGVLDALPDHMPKCRALSLIASQSSERLAHQLVHLRRLQFLMLQIHGHAPSREWLAQHTAPHLPATLHTLTLVTDQLDKLVDNVCALPRLAHLVLHCVPPPQATAESSEAVNYLAGADPVFNGTLFPELTRVEVHSGKLTHALVSSFAQLPQLQVLVLHGAIVPALASCTAACKWTLPRVHTLEAPPPVLEQVLARIRLPAWYWLVVHPDMTATAAGSAGTASAAMAATTTTTAAAKAHGGTGNGKNGSGATADKAAEGSAISIDHELPLSFKFARLRALHVARCKHLGLNRTHMAQLAELSVHPRQLMRLGSTSKFGAHLTTLLIEPDSLSGVMHLNTALAFPHLKALYLGASHPPAVAGHAAGTPAATVRHDDLDRAHSVRGHAAAVATAPMRLEPAAKALAWITALPSLCALYIRYPLRLVFPATPSPATLSLTLANAHSGHVWRELARGLDFAPTHAGRPHAGAVADRPPPVVQVHVAWAPASRAESDALALDMVPLLVALGRREDHAVAVAQHACEAARNGVTAAAARTAPKTALAAAGIVHVLGGHAMMVADKGAASADTLAEGAPVTAKHRVDSAVGSSASSSREGSPVTVTRRRRGSAAVSAAAAGGGGVVARVQRRRRATVGSVLVGSSA